MLSFGALIIKPGISERAWTVNIRTSWINIATAVETTVIVKNDETATAMTHN